MDSNKEVHYRELPDSTKTVINYAIGYYSSFNRIANLDFKILEPSIRDVKDKEKFVLSMFLSIISNSSVKNFLMNDNLDFDSVIKFFGWNMLNGKNCEGKQKKVIKDNIFNRIIDIQNKTGISYYKITPAYLLLAFLDENIYSDSILIEILKKYYDCDYKDKYFYKELVRYNDEILNNEDYKRYDDKKDNELKQYGYFLEDDGMPLIGRDMELENLMISLLSFNSSVLLTGPAGVGKTAIVMYLAKLLNDKNVPKSLIGKRIFQIEASTFVEGCCYVGQSEARFKAIFDKIIRDNSIILFVDEIHTLMGMGTSEKSSNGLNDFLKIYLKTDKLQMIGATTDSEYDRIVSMDAAFKRRFDRIIVKEPADDDVVKIVRGVIKHYEKKSNMKFAVNDSIIPLLVESTSSKNRRFDDESHNPDLALDVIRACFGCAKYNDRDSVVLEDVIRAMYKVDRIYSAIREDFIKKVRTFSNETTNEKVKILKFQPKMK